MIEERSYDEQLLIEKYSHHVIRVWSRNQTFLKNGFAVGLGEMSLTSLMSRHRITPRFRVPGLKFDVIGVYARHPMTYHCMIRTIRLMDLSHMNSCLVRSGDEIFRRVRQEF